VYEKYLRKRSLLFVILDYFSDCWKAALNQLHS